MKCIIIEDQPPAQRILKKFIDDVDALELIGVFSDALQAMEFLKTQPTDLMFLDIHLPKITGLDFLKSLPNAPHVILTTAFSEYALESYDLNVVDYLLKPFSFQRFLKAVAKVPVASAPAEITNRAELQEVEKDYIYLKSGHEHIKIQLTDIVHIQADSDYTEVFLLEHKHLSNEPLRYWVETLPTKNFIRVHKSHIVNTDLIEKWVGNLIHVAGGSKIPIGRAFKEKFLAHIMN